MCDLLDNVTKIYLLSATCDKLTASSRLLMPFISLNSGIHTVKEDLLLVFGSPDCIPINALLSTCSKNHHTLRLMQYYLQQSSSTNPFWRFSQTSLLLTLYKHSMQLEREGRPKPQWSFMSCSTVKYLLNNCCSFWIKLFQEEIQKSTCSLVLESYMSREKNYGTFDPDILRLDNAWSKPDTTWYINDFSEIGNACFS